MTDGRIDLIGKLWSIGNVITGFTVLQSIAVIYFALEKTDVVKRWDAFVPLTILAIAGGTGLYMWVVWLCFKLERCLRNEINDSATSIEISRKVFVGRLVTIAIFNGLAFSITIMAWRWVV